MRANKTNQVHKIALYIRVSTEEQAQNPEGSIKSQEQRLRQCVQLRNLEQPYGEVTMVFVDRAKSGKNTKRPELQRLLQAVRTKEVTLVMVTELSRLSRSIKDFCSMWDLMRDHGCEFQSLREQFDTTSAAGEMVLYTLANIAQFERKQIGERVTANFKARAERGLYNGGTVPLGYKLDPNKKGYLFVEDETAVTVREVYSTFLVEQNIANTGKSLNARGIKLKRHIEGGGRSVRTSHFTVSNLTSILKNKAYIGVREYKINGEWKTFKATWEPILEERIFYRAQEVLAKAALRQEKINLPNRYPFLLTTMAYCGKCGTKLFGRGAHGNGGKFIYYEHSWSTKTQALLKEKIHECHPVRFNGKGIEQRVWSEVVKLMTQPEFANVILEKAQKLFESRGHVIEVDTLKKKQSGIEDQLQALAEHLTKIPKTVSPTPIFQQMEKLEASKVEVLKEIEDATAQSSRRDKLAPLKDYKSFLAGIGRLVNDGTAAEVRAKVIQKLIHKVEISTEKLRVHYYVGAEKLKQNFWEAERLLAPKMEMASDLEATQKTLKYGSIYVESGWIGGFPMMSASYMMMLADVSKNLFIGLTAPS